MHKFTHPDYQNGFKAFIFSLMHCPNRLDRYTYIYLFIPSLSNIVVLATSLSLSDRLGFKRFTAVIESFVSIAPWTSRKPSN